jgi:hypothetical protein
MSSTEWAPPGTTRPWPADRVERWPIARLIPYANNPRLHSEADLDKIAAAILKWGWTMPVLTDEQGLVLAGHGRIGAAAKLGLSSVPVIVAHGWSEDEKRSYRLADNQLAARASWDPDQLRDELRMLEFNGFDLGLVGFEPDRLQEILAGLGSGSLADPDNVPEIPAQSVTEPGDIWLLNHHRVGCGDSTRAEDVAPVLEGAVPHLLVTDPPYGVSYDRGERAAASTMASSRRARCSTTIVPTGGRPMPCSPAMSPMSGTGLCAVMLSPPIWQLAGCSCAPRSFGRSSTSP